VIVSMTGFGRAEVEDNEYRYGIEIKSFNNRFLEISTRLPRLLIPYENEFRQKIKNHLARGKVYLFIQEPREIQLKDGFTFDPETVHQLIEGMRELGRKTGLRDDLSLSNLLTILDYLHPEEDESLIKRRLNLALTGVEQALGEFKRLCRAEGENLEKELRSRSSLVANLLDQIETKAAENLGLQFEKLSQRIEKYIPADQVDPGRLEQEVAYLVDRMDITEEVVRLRSHLELFSSAMDDGEDIGKRLNFLLQEMNREVNTMGSKAASPEITGWIVQIKEELEKMREQVQNVS